MEDRTVARHTHMPFGKFKGKPLSMLVRSETEYMKWFVTLPSMDAYPGLSVNIYQELARLAELDASRNRNSYTLKRMKVVYPRIKTFWVYTESGKVMRQTSNRKKNGDLYSLRLYRFELYGRKEYVYGVRIKDQWFGFVEGTEKAGLAYLETAHNRKRLIIDRKMEEQRRKQNSG